MYFFVLFLKKIHRWRQNEATRKDIWLIKNKKKAIFNLEYSEYKKLSLKKEKEKSHLTFEYLVSSTKQTVFLYREGMKKHEKTDSWNVLVVGIVDVVLGDGGDFCSGDHSYNF